MKTLKIQLSILLLLSTSLSLFSQRVADLRVRIISPIQDSYLKSPEIVTIKFSAFNQGPDNINVNDTFRCYPKTNDSLFKYKYFFFPKVLIPGDSVIFMVDIPFKAYYDNNYYILAIWSAVAFNRSVGGLLPENLIMQKDNSPSITV